jgi:hypothetical protein
MWILNDNKFIEFQPLILNRLNHLKGLLSFLWITNLENLIFVQMLINLGYFNIDEFGIRMLTNHGKRLFVLIYYLLVFILLLISMMNIVLFLLLIYFFSLSELNLNFLLFFLFNLFRLFSIKKFYHILIFCV